MHRFIEGENCRTSVMQMFEYFVSAYFQAVFKDYPPPYPWGHDMRTSPRSRRHQAATASHIHTDSSQSYLQWRRRLWKITMNELLQFNTKFVSLMAK